ncbi:MAG: hypothetical protein Q8S84_02690 [bacterium]|nr:hypothetical protein [bacterium]MDP3380449.1 hypothetical protein [bacterium]
MTSAHNNSNISFCSSTLILLETVLNLVPYIHAKLTNALAVFQLDDSIIIFLFTEISSILSLISHHAVLSFTEPNGLKYSNLTKIFTLSNQ